MAATYVEAYDLLQDDELGKQIKFALYREAVELRLAPGSTPAQREWALKVLRDGTQLPLRYIATRVLSQPQIFNNLPTIADTAVQTVIGNLIPELIRES